MSSSIKTFPSRPDCHCTFHACVKWQEQAEREIVNLQRSLADAITAQANIRETAEAKLAFHTRCSAENRDALQEYARSVDEENKKLRAMIDGMKESSAGLADAMQTLKQRHQELGMQLDEVQKTVQKGVGKEDAAGDEPMDWGGGDKTDVAVPNQFSPALPYLPPEQTDLLPTTFPAPAPKLPPIERNWYMIPPTKEQLKTLERNLLRRQIRDAELNRKGRSASPANSSRRRSQRKSSGSDEGEAAPSRIGG